MYGVPKNESLYFSDIPINMSLHGYKSYFPPLAGRFNQPNQTTPPPAKDKPAFVP